MSDRRILLADDSPTIQKVVNLTFADEGIDVVCASDGDSAYQMMSEFTPDLVLADVNMPGKTGYELCAALRERQETRDTPVILLVGSFEPFDEERALQVGANDYFTKPFQSIRQLVNTVSELMRRSEATDEFGAVEDTLLEDTQPDIDLSSDVAEPSAAPEHDDIESLYRQSLHETVEIPKEVARDHDDLTDTALDDELIETEVADSVERDDNIEMRSGNMEIVSPIDTGELQFSERGFDSSDAIRFEDTIRDEYPASEDSAELGRIETATGDLAGQSTFELPAEESTATEGVEMETARPFEQDNEITREFEIVPPIESDSAEPVEQMAEEVDEIPVEPRDLDEANVLDEISLEYRNYDEANVLDLPTAKPEPVPHESALHSAAQFSPEMMEQLADRVAEKVSESLARKLAGLVVPEVMKKMEEDRNRIS